MAQCPLVIAPYDLTAFIIYINDTDPIDFSGALMTQFETDQNIKKYTYAVYLLQALSFVLLITALLGIIINYVKYEDVQGSWLQSHFIWQKNTFWYGLLWILLGVMTTFLLVGYAVLGMATIWLIYRIAKGWIYLVDGKELYPQR